MDNFDFAQMFWKHILTNLKLNDVTPVSDPAERLRELIDQGMFKGMPTERFDSIVRSINKIKPIWKNSKAVPAMTILLNVLQHSNANEAEIARLAGCLTEYAKVSEPVPAHCELSASGDDAAQYDNEPLYIDEADSPDDGRSARPAPVRVEWTPRMIYNMLGQHVHGQDDAGRAASIIMYNALQGRRTNAVFCGPTGCGKTEIWRRMQRAFPDQVRIIDAARLSADGWKGTVHIRDIFDGLDPAEIRTHGLVVVLDEADKLFCEPMFGSSDTNYSTITQNSLLRMLDGDIIGFGAGDGHNKALKVDCAYVSVVMLGAFERLMKTKNAERRTHMGFDAGAHSDELDYGNSTITHEELTQVGMRREIAGRVSRIVRLRPLGIDDYREILTGCLLDELGSNYGGHIEIPGPVVDSLAREAMGKKLGVRWMRSRLTTAMDDIIFEHPGTRDYRIDTVAEEAGRR